MRWPARLRRRAKPLPPNLAQLQPIDWQAIALAMQVRAPHDVDGEQWGNGHDEGIHIVQCHLRGQALGTLDPVRRVELLTLEVSLNDLRIDHGDPRARATAAAARAAGQRMHERRLRARR